MATLAYDSGRDGFRTVFESAGIGIGLVARNGQILHVNAAFQQLVGYTQQELRCMPLWQWTHPEDRSTDEALHTQLAAGERSRYQLEKRYLRKDGQTVWVRLTASVLPQDSLGNNPTESREAEPRVFAVKMVEDITDRVIAERQLRNSESRLRSFVENAPFILFLKDQHSRYVIVNPPAAVPFNRPPAEIVGKTDSDLFAPERAAANYAEDHQILTSRQPAYAVVNIPAADGQFRTINRIKFPLLDAAGEVSGICGIAVDVTEQRRAEIALRASEERYRLVSQATNDVIWDRDLVNHQIFFSENAQGMFGCDYESMRTDLGFWREHVHTDDRERVMAGVHAFLDGRNAGTSGERWCDEYRFRRADDGRYMYIEDRGYLTRDAAGKPVRMIGAMKDVTARHVAEQQLRQRDALLQALAEATATLLSCPDFDAALQAALRTLARAAGADRARFSDLRPASDSVEPRLVLRHQWCGTEMSREDAQATGLGDECTPTISAEWWPILRGGQHVVASPAVLAEGAQSGLVARQIRSMLLVPVIIDGLLCGLIGLETCIVEHAWTDAEASIVAAAANSIANAMVRSRTEAKLQHDSLHDPLTGLPNRSLLADRIDQCIRRAQHETNYHFAVLFLDLDRFKLVNDSLGHAAGDELLRTVARRLLNCVRNVDNVGQLGVYGKKGNCGEHPALTEREDTVARLGGDEFTILLSNVRQAGNAARVAERILAALRKPIVFQGQEIFVAASIGIVSAEGSQYGCAKDLLRDADISMYQAKSRGRGNYVVFDGTMHEAAVSRLKLETDLSRAVERDELRLHYQPILSLATNRAIGFEALVRWQHDGKLISPAEFIPIAEETGAIVSVGAWVLREATRQLARWQAELAPDAPAIRMSLNLSRRQLADPNLPDTIRQALSDAGVRPDRLTLEITESMIMPDAEAAQAVLQRLREIGVQLALDDFGTGYSSLACLGRLPIDVLKIDRSFLVNAAAIRGAAAMRAIVSLAHTLEMSVIAEGVEEPEQALFLRSLGCDSAQGYWFSLPLPVDSAARWYAEHNAPLRSAS